MLLFGPPVKRLSAVPDERLLQNKRIEIFDALVAAGHTVVYAEDVVEPGFMTNLPYAVSTREYDLILSYVSLHTAQTELMIIGSDEEVARKTMIFWDDRGQGTNCQLLCDEAVQHGARQSTFSFPDDIHSCNLKGMSLTHAEAIQARRFSV